MVALPRADLGRVQPVRLHHRHLGEEFRAARDHSRLIVTPLTFLGGAFYSIDMLPPVLAHRQLVQSGRLSRERLPLELLWPRRRQRRGQPRLHDAVHRGLSGGAVVDFPHRLSTQAVISSRRSRESATIGFRQISNPVTRWRCFPHDRAARDVRRGCDLGSGRNGLGTGGASCRGGKSTNISETFLVVAANRRFAAAPRECPFSRFHCGAG